VLAIRAISSSFGLVLHRLERVLVGNLIAALVGSPVFIVSGLAAYFTGQVLVGAIVASILLGVLPNPATAGLQLMAHDMAAGEYLLMAGPLDGIRLYWKVALRFWLIGALVTLVLGVNCIFYTNAHFTGSGVVQFAAIYVFMTWIAAHVYVYPLIIEQEVKTVRLVYRNAFVITLSHPLFTVQILVAWLAVLLLTSSSGLIVAVGLALAAMIQQNAMARILPTYRQKRATEQDPAAS